MQKQFMKFQKYGKTHATNFKFVSKIFFKLYDIAGKTQREKNSRNKIKTQRIFRLKIIIRKDIVLVTN